MKRGKVIQLVGSAAGVAGVVYASMYGGQALVIVSILLLICAAAINYSED